MQKFPISIFRFDISLILCDICGKINLILYMGGNDTETAYHREVGMYSISEPKTIILTRALENNGV